MRTSGAPGHVLYLGRYTVLEFRDPLPVLEEPGDTPKKAKIGDLAINGLLSTTT